MCLYPYPPPERDRSIDVRTMGAKPIDLSREKLSLQHLYPRAGEERDFGERTMGGGVNGTDLNGFDLAGSQRQPKNSRCKSYTPRADEERDSDERTMGWSRW
jgi:hypothetical protein